MSSSDITIPADEGPAAPDRVIAYLLYALEDVRSLSPRGMILLANAIVAVAEDTHALDADEIRRSLANDLLVN